MIRMSLYFTLLVSIPAWAFPVEPNQSAWEPPTGVLNWTEVQELVLTRHAGLKAQALSISKAQARLEQVSLWDNPELAVDMENIGGTAPRNGFRGTETTILLTQPIPAAGKRGLQKRVAESDKGVYEAQLAQTRLDVLLQARQAFWEVLAMQAQVDLAHKQVATVESLLDAVNKRVQAGKDSPVEQNKARIAVADQRMSVQSMESQLQQARVRLAILWGGQDRFINVEEAFEVGEALPDNTALLARLETHPTLKQWSKAIEQAKAQKDLARKERYGDWSVSGGIKRLEDEGETTAVLGVAIPLPVFNRNQGRRKEATYHLAQVRALKEASQQALTAALQNRVIQTRQIFAQVVTLRDEILPQAKEAYERSIKGYEQGRFDYLHVLDAQRLWFEQSQRYLDTLQTYGLIKAEVLSMAGLTFEPSPNEGVSHER